jgi:hypothetical protein
MINHFSNSVIVLAATRYTYWSPRPSEHLHTPVRLVQAYVNEAQVATASLSLFLQKAIDCNRMGGI